MAENQEGSHNKTCKKKSYTELIEGAPIFLQVTFSFSNWEREKLNILSLEWESHLMVSLQRLKI